MKYSLPAFGFVVLLFTGLFALGAGPLPEFTYQGVALHPKDLTWIPTGELEHPSLIKVEGRVKNPLGKYYFYYSPHKHYGTGLAYSDSIEGPWKEYEGNPVIEGPAAPDIRWIEEKGKFYMWGHRANKRTELWTSEDGLHFEHEGVSVEAKHIGTKNATYTRMYEYPIEKYNSKYIMLYSGLLEKSGARCAWLAYSKDAKNWTQLETPLIEPSEGDKDAIYGAALFQWQKRNFIVYQDQTAWRGGNVKYVEVDHNLSPIGKEGKRFVLLDPPAELNERYRSAEFYREGNTIYMLSGAGSNPRITVYATATLGATPPKDKEGVVPAKSGTSDEIHKDTLLPAD